MKKFIAQVIIIEIVAITLCILFTVFDVSSCISRIEKAGGLKNIVIEKEINK